MDCKSPCPCVKFQSEKCDFLKPYSENEISPGYYLDSLVCTQSDNYETGKKLVMENLICNEHQSLHV